MTTSKPYTADFYLSQQEGSLKSAEEIVPLVVELLKPKSVIDIGCGVGAWLSVFKKLGIVDILGVDGGWVNRELLKIPPDNFMVLDLTNPLRLQRQFDLVMSLEVAEHLPIEYAKQFVKSLTDLGPVVLFAAAIPQQGGADHLNEQWPDYWATLFKERGYGAIDCIRKHIWDSDNIKYWYAQNMLLFVKLEYLRNDSLLQNEFNKTNIKMLSLVHPKHYLLSLSNNNLTLGQVIGALPSVISRSLAFRINKFLKRW
jgi:SAM-dependent methyltransferase